MVTAEQIADVYGIKLFSVNKFYPFLRKWMEFYNINTPLQQAQFLAQIGHESGRFYYTEEIASGEAYEWRKDLDKAIKLEKFSAEGFFNFIQKHNDGKEDKDKFNLTTEDWM